jgi:hypothetical protein
MASIEEAAHGCAGHVHEREPRAIKRTAGRRAVTGPGVPSQRGVEVLVDGGAFRDERLRPRLDQVLEPIAVQEDGLVERLAAPPGDVGRGGHRGVVDIGVVQRREKPSLEFACSRQSGSRPTS